MIRLLIFLYTTLIFLITNFLDHILKEQEVDRLLLDLLKLHTGFNILQNEYYLLYNTFNNQFFEKLKEFNDVLIYQPIETIYNQKIYVLLGGFIYIFFFFRIKVLFHENCPVLIYQREIISLFHGGMYYFFNWYMLLLIFPKSKIDNFLLWLVQNSKEDFISISIVVIIYCFIIFFLLKYIFFRKFTGKYFFIGLRILQVWYFCINFGFFFFLSELTNKFDFFFNLCKIVLGGIADKNIEKRLYFFILFSFLLMVFLCFISLFYYLYLKKKSYQELQELYKIATFFMFNGYFQYKNKILDEINNNSEYLIFRLTIIQTLAWGQKCLGFLYLLLISFFLFFDVYFYQNYFFQVTFTHEHLFTVLLIITGYFFLIFFGNILTIFIIKYQHFQIWLEISDQTKNVLFQQKKRFLIFGFLFFKIFCLWGFVFSCYFIIKTIISFQHYIIPLFLSDESKKVFLLILSNNPVVLEKINIVPLLNCINEFIFYGNNIQYTMYGCQFLFVAVAVIILHSQYFRENIYYFFYFLGVDAAQLYQVGLFFKNEKKVFYLFIFIVFFLLIITIGVDYLMILPLCHKFSSEWDNTNNLIQLIKSLQNIALNRPFVKNYYDKAIILLVEYNNIQTHLEIQFLYTIFGIKGLFLFFNIILFFYNLNLDRKILFNSYSSLILFNEITKKNQEQYYQDYFDYFLKNNNIVYRKFFFTLHELQLINNYYKKKEEL
jgi:hypothetical protein